jgi:hypothetical protein
VSAETADNPSVVLHEARHTHDLHVKGDLDSMSPQQIIDDTMGRLEKKGYFPEYLLKELRKEAERFAKLNF